MQLKSINPHWLELADFWCPWCGELFEDDKSPEDSCSGDSASGGKQRLQCLKCEKDFEMTRTLAYSYSVAKIYTNKPNNLVNHKIK